MSLKRPVEMARTKPGPPRIRMHFFLCLIQRRPWTNRSFSFLEMPGKELVVSFVQSRGRAASPLAAGNRNVQVDVMGGADASRPESGGKCVRTFPATPFGMTGSGGQGLPALPHPCAREIARFSPDNSLVSWPSFFRSRPNCRIFHHCRKNGRYLVLRGF